MNLFDKIKFVLARGSGKCVVLQDENPKYVVMTWDEYEKMEKLIEELKKGGDFGTIDINDLPL